MLNSRSRSLHKQTGVALIAVLVIIIVVTVLGITAMRMSITGLTLATNSQASNLLFQAADMGLQRLEASVTGGDPNANVTNAMSAAGIFGKLSDNPLCMSTRGAVWGTGVNQVTGFTNGACTAGTAEQYISARNLVVTQVNYLRRPQTNYSSNASVANLSAGLGNSTPPIQPDVLTITSSAIMPTLGSADLDTINGCLAKPSDDSGNLKAKDAASIAAAAEVETITDCLTDSGAIFTTHQNMYLLGF